MKNKNISSLVNSVLILLLACSFVETFTYSGFLVKHFSAAIGFGLLISLVITFVIFRKLYKSSLFGKMIVISTYFLTFTYLVFDTLEKINYPNYVFSRFHLNTYLLLLSTIIMTVIFLINSDKMKVNIYIYSVLAVIMIQYSAANLIGISKSNIEFMLKNPKATYDQKMRMAIEKKPYDYALFIKANTSAESTILIPPQGYPWPQTGNKAYLRYFLYPRNLVSSYEYEPGVDLKNIDYVLIDYGETTISEHGFTNVWPKFDVKGEYIIYWNPETNQTWRDKTGIYKYNPNDKSEKWGIIKITH